jgi:hypothetical protein
LDSHGGDDERPPLRYVQRRATVVAVPDVQAHGGDCRPDEDRVDDVIREESLMSDAITVYGIDFTSSPSRRKPISCLECRLVGDVLQTVEIREWQSFEEFEQFLAMPSAGPPWIAGMVSRAARRWTTAAEESCTIGTMRED